MKGKTPWSVSPMMSRAYTIACVEIRPRPPGHHFVDEIVGELITNSSVAGSKVAVVSSPRTLEPWPISVWASEIVFWVSETDSSKLRESITILHVPRIWCDCASGSHLACCSGDIWPRIAPMNMPSDRLEATPSSGGNA